MSLLVDRYAQHKLYIVCSAIK